MDINKLTLCAAALGSLLLLPPPLPAQSWVATSASGQRWTSLAASADGNQLAAASQSGALYLSLNGGAKWTPAHIPSQPWNAVASSADGTTLLAVANPGALYLSTNSGAAWTAVPDSTNAWFAAAASSDGTRLVAAANNAGIFTSADAGATWTASLLATNWHWQATACSADATTLVAAVDPGLLFVSTNGGAEWSTSSLPVLSWTSLAVSADGTKLAAAATLDGIYLSTDSGATWAKSSAPTLSWSSLACSADGSRLIASVLYGGIYCSTNSGQDWTQTDAAAMEWSAVATSSSGKSLVAAVFGGGIYVPGAQALAGSYAGLFFDPTNVVPESSGCFTATLAKGGSLSAKLQVAGKSYSFAGRFTREGVSSNVVARPKLPPLTVVLEPVLRGDALAGWVSDGTWTAQLAANRAVFSRANPYSATSTKYTLALAANGDALEIGTDPASPGLVGFGTAGVDALGRLTFSGTLGDGTPVTQKTFVSKQGWWPFYVSDHSASSLVLGWLNFTNATNSDLDGSVTWLKGPSSKGKFYAAGFTNQIGVVGSMFRATNGAAALPFTNGQVWLVNGNLTQPGFTNFCVQSPNNVVIGTNKLKLNISAASGAFKGSIANPETGKQVTLNGVILQKLNVGIGAFLGTNQAGGLLLVPNH